MGRADTITTTLTIPTPPRGKSFQKLAADLGLNLAETQDPPNHEVLLLVVDLPESLRDSLPRCSPTARDQSTDWSAAVRGVEAKSVCLL